MLFVRASGYFEATGPFGEPGPFDCHSYSFSGRIDLQCRIFVVCDPGLCGLPGPGGGKRWGCLTVMVSQIGIFIRQVGLALPSHLYNSFVFFSYNKTTVKFFWRRVAYPCGEGSLGGP